ncbi:MAG: protease modulator HflC, partial [Butyrivibrio sp.]|nr:protease modulator HflC [Butyrivibrio sp.]
MEKNKKGILPILIIAAIAVVLFLIGSATYIVHQNEYVTVRRFGKIVAIADDPGLHFRTPFIEDVQTISAKAVLYDIPASDVITKDKKSMITDTY